jgi:hypothetical protein
MRRNCFSFFTLLIFLFQWNCNQNVDENKNQNTVDSIEIKDNVLNITDSTKLIKSLKSYLKSGKNQTYKLYKSIIYNNLGFKTTEIIYKPNGDILRKTNYEYGKNGKLEFETSWDYYLKNDRYIKSKFIYDNKNRMSKILFFSDSITIFETKNYSYNSFDSISKQISIAKDNKVESIYNYLYNQKHQKVLETLTDNSIIINHKIVYEYDSRGNLIFQKDSASNYVIYLIYNKFDKTNHLIETINLYRDNTLVEFDTISNIKYTYEADKLFEEHWVLKDRISIKTYKYSGKYLIAELETEKNNRTQENINDSQTKYFYEFYN